jgi:SAM-dependent methyltransferase
MAGRIANVVMAKAWDGDEGEEWARDWQVYDRAVRVHHDALMAAAAVEPGERVLDVGCGNGETTRAAARASGTGEVLGVDLSSQMIRRARELAAAEGLANAAFEHADAQVHGFEPAAYDVALSRFGAMFFADAETAFRNIGDALRPGGRLLMVGWRGLDANEWQQCLVGALAAGRDLPLPPPGAPGPLAFADADRLRTLLAAAGYRDVTLDPVDGPMWFGADADSAYAWFSGTSVTRSMVSGLDDAARSQALDALRSTIKEHDTGDGVLFGSGTWLVRARR